MKAIAPYGAASCSGKLNDVVHLPGKTRQVVRTHRVGKKPALRTHQTVQAALQFAAINWQTLPPLVRQSYADAATRGHLWSANPGTFATAITLYTAVVIHRRLRGLLTTPGRWTSPPLYPITDLSLEAFGTIVTVRWTFTPPPGPDDNDLVELHYAGPYSRGRKPDWTHTHYATWAKVADETIEYDLRDPGTYYLRVRTTDRQWPVAAHQAEYKLTLPI